MKDYENMTPDERRELIEEIKRERAKISDPIERIAFDNGANDKHPFAFHLVAALESRGNGRHES
jgi:hypothetical protein